MMQESCQGMDPDTSIRSRQKGSHSRESGLPAFLVHDGQAGNLPLFDPAVERDPRGRDRTEHNATIWEAV